MDSPPNSITTKSGTDLAENGSSMAALDELVVAGRRFFTARRLAEIFNRSTRTIARWEAAGTLPRKIKVGNTVLFDCDRVLACLEEHEAELGHQRSCN
jgi:hypothetical protein